MSNRDRRVLVRQRLREVNTEWRMWSKQKERTPERAVRMGQLNGRRMELVIEIVDLDRQDRLRQLKLSHGDTITVFCSHDSDELQMLQCTASLAICSRPEHP